MKKNIMLLTLLSLAFIGCNVEQHGSDPSQTKGKDYAATDQDQQLLQQVKKALQSNQALSQNVNVEVSHGTVTLGGTVPALEAKDTLEKAIKAIPNVKNVRNEIKVETSTQH